MKQWRWIEEKTVLAVHSEQLAEHGGLTGTRDKGLLESALAKPQNNAAYGNSQIEELAAAYAFGIARNHPFNDGNKRTAFVAMELFLNLNEHRLCANNEECLKIMLQVAAGDISEKELAAWVKGNIEKR